jgi:hypothetical protein
MLYRSTARNRLGTTALEAAVVLPVTFLLLLSILIGGMGIFKFQEVAHVARETARFASVHGGQYAKQNAAAIAVGSLPVVDEAYLISYAQSKAIGMDPSLLQISVSMTVLRPGTTSSTDTETVDWDNTTENQNRSPYSAWTNTNTTPASNVQLENMVIVQVTYAWSPGLFGLGTINLTSTAVMPMSY